jgi:hypothetical protein
VSNVYEVRCTNSLLAGLVAIAGPAAVINPWMAFITGFGAAVVYVGPRPSPRALQRTRALLSPLYCHDHNVQRVACCGAAPVAVVLS